MWEQPKHEIDFRRNYNSVLFVSLEKAKISERSFLELAQVLEMVYSAWLSWLKDDAATLNLYFHRTLGAKHMNK